MPRGVEVPSGTSRGMNVPYIFADAFMPNLLPSSVSGTVASGSSGPTTPPDPIRKVMRDSAQSVCTADLLSKQFRVHALCSSQS